AGPRPKGCRDDHAALAIEVHLEGAREEEAREGSGARVRDGKRRRLGGEGVPVAAREDREAGVDPARDERSSLELGTKTRWDGHASLLVHRMPVLAGEHPSGFPTGWAWLRAAVAAVTGADPRSTTGHHFVPLHGILHRCGDASMGNRARLVARARRL